MARIERRPLAESDLIDIWVYIAADNPIAADRMLDGIEQKLRALASQPYMGRARPELGEGLRSFSLGNYVVYYLPTSGGIELVRVRSARMEIDADDLT